MEPKDVLVEQAIVRSNLRVADIMTRNPVTVQPGQTLRAALETMDTHDCHHLPVISPSGHLVGVVTARECRLALRIPELVRDDWHHLETIDKLTVRDIMNTNVVVAEPSTLTKEAARLMLLNYSTCIAILLGETLVGIVTVSDILVAFVSSF
ncbi:MAG: CBS domain-containing protein [Anaerolineae bacterium]|nr:CBS domain-containing protein [Anaerolineae bacterium]